MLKTVPLLHSSNGIDMEACYLYRHCHLQISPFSPIVNSIEESATIWYCGNTMQQKPKHSGENTWYCWRFANYGNPDKYSYVLPCYFLHGWIGHVLIFLMRPKVQLPVLS